MEIKEKVAYIQGLVEGLYADNEGEGKIFASIIDILSDMADEIESLNENALDIGDELDALSDDLADVENFLEELDDGDNFGDDDDWFDYDDDDDDDNNFDDDDDDFGDDDDDGVFFGSDDNCDICGGCGGPEFTLDINCPECNAEIEIDEKAIAKQSVTCPACGKPVELQIDEVDADDDE